MHFTHLNKNITEPDMHTISAFKVLWKGIEWMLAWTKLEFGELVMENKWMAGELYGYFAFVCIRGYK